MAAIAPRSDTNFRWPDISLRSVKARLRQEFPAWLWTLLTSVMIIATAIFLYRFSSRFDIDVRWVFAKEGPIEDVTFITGLAAAVMCALAAGHRWTHRQNSVDRWLAASFGACALGLFVYAMEEISWTQTFLRFETPESWAAINHQQETTLHNLLDRHALEPVAMWAGLGLSIGALSLIAVGMAVRNRYWREIAPHWSLAPYALLLAYASVRTHSEVTEALLPLFFCFYGYRIYRRARDSTPVA
jgi:hypothetical protein